MSAGGADPKEGQFAKREKERQERVAKNEYQRLKNIARAAKKGGLRGEMVWMGLHLCAVFEAMKFDF